jgi:hypothetical protein
MAWWLYYLTVLAPRNLTRNVIRQFPARPATPEERTLLGEWLAAAGDVALAYVSSRQSDDPVLRHRIVIITDPRREPSHFVHAPPSRNIWMVFSRGRKGTRVSRFPTLLAALNSIRPVIVNAPLMLLDHGAGDLAVALAAPRSQRKGRSAGCFPTAGTTGRGFRSLPGG